MKWISVKEKLPENRGKTIVHCQTDDGPIIDCLYFDKGNWHLDGEPLFCQTCFIEVTDWVPLPPPPEPEQKVNY